MVLVVKCLICNKELTYTQCDPSELIAHIKREHPSVGKRSGKPATVHKEAKTKSERRVESDIRESLIKNSTSLENLIDKEVQTNIVWNNFEMINRKQQVDSISPSQLSKGFASDSNVTVLNQQMSSTQQSKDSSSSSKVTVVRKPSSSTPTPRQTVSSPARLSDVKKVSKKTSPNQRKEQLSRERIQMNVGNDSPVVYTPNESFKPNEQASSSERKRVKFYKTSIERWQPVGDDKIHCPRCLSHKRPIVRTHTERVTESSFVSTLLMTCWPFCLSPCLFPEPTHEKLHCPVCNLHLGTYDHQRKTVMLNPKLQEIEH